MGQSKFGELPDGRAVTAFTLDTAEGLELTVLDFGATVQRLRMRGCDGQLADVALGFAELDSYLSSDNPYLGGIVGRFANRIAHGRFTLDGVTHRLDSNEGGTCLHGGVDGFHRRIWTVLEHDAHSLTMELLSLDGDQGFPGELMAKVRYQVVDNSVAIRLSAVSDSATVVNLTTHTYFNLGNPNSATIDDHVLSVNADGYLPVDDQSIPLGSVEDVGASPFDFRVGARLAPRVRAEHPQVVRVSGIDHAYVLRGSGMREAARLGHPPSGRFVQIDTDQPSIQVYTGNSFDGTLRGRHGGLLRQGDGIALEAQGFPNAPNEPGFPSTVLRPGKTYSSNITWRFGTQRVT
ncbi:hypothetical protein ASG95_20610 [Phycicoccus sp. Soil803]|nr:hypothetical protein ASG95_20610 [Phycicoccus sp. Soil803]